jgi:hypothetical protein
MELYLSSLIRLYGVVLHELSTEGRLYFITVIIIIIIIIVIIIIVVVVIESFFYFWLNP